MARQEKVPCCFIPLLKRRLSLVCGQSQKFTTTEKDLSALLETDVKVELYTQQLQAPVHAEQLYNMYSDYTVLEEIFYIFKPFLPSFSS